MKAMCPGGCGETGSLKSITAHMASCSDVAKRFVAGDELLSPVEMYQRHAAEQAPAPARRAPRRAASEVSGVSATVRSAPAKPKAPAVPRQRKEAPARPARTPGPVAVEYWSLPERLA